MPKVKRNLGHSDFCACKDCIEEAYKNKEPWTQIEIRRSTKRAAEMVVIDAARAFCQSSSTKNRKLLKFAVLAYNKVR